MKNRVRYYNSDLRCRSDVLHSRWRYLTLKQCEDSEDYIIRLYDSFNCRSEVNIDFGLPVKSAEICDLMENPIDTAEIFNNSIKLTVSNFEIITLKVSFKNS